MKWLRRLMVAVHGLIALLFICASLMLLVVAVRIGWQVVGQGLQADAAQAIIDAVGYLAAAVVALQIAQTVAEEEIVRDTHISSPTRVRRFLSRFLVVVVVALAIEGLVATFRALHENPAELRYAAGIIAATGLLLAGWGCFIRLNRAAEDLEPEAMEEAKAEDTKLQ